MEVTRLAITQGAVPKGGGLSGSIVATTTQADFGREFAAWLRDYERERPFAEIRELEARIATGDGKLSAATARGMTEDDANYRAASDKLAGLKARRAELTDTAQIPFLAWNTIHNFLRSSRGWGLPRGSYVEICVPGRFASRVDVSESDGLPF